MTETQKSVKMAQVALRILDVDKEISIHTTNSYISFKYRNGVIIAGIRPNANSFLVGVVVLDADFHLRYTLTDEGRKSTVLYDNQLVKTGEEDLTELLVKVGRIVRKMWLHCHPE